MISDIRSTLNTTSDKQNASGTVSNNIGTIAKLMSELKFIENMSLIKFQGSETLNHQGKPVQLLHAISSQQHFTLINTGTPIDTSDIKSAQLNKTNPLQATLTTTKETFPSQTVRARAPQTNRTDNLILASRVVNLTVISTPIPTGTTTQVNTPQTPPAATQTQSTATQTQSTATQTQSTATQTPPTATQTPPTATQTPPTATQAPLNTAQVPDTTKPTNAQTQIPISSNTTSQVNTTPAPSTPANSTNTPQGTLPPANSNQNHSAQTTVAQNSANQSNLIQKNPMPEIPIQSSQSNSPPSTLIQNTPIHSTPINNSTAQTGGAPFLVTVTDGKTEFPILSQTELKRGDVVRVLVDINNQMQALPPKTAPTTISPHLEALKQSLPKQLSFNDMSQLVRQLNTMSESSNLPSQTQQALRQLVQSMPTLAGITASPEAMKQAIQTSGVFTESLLLNDNKTQLPEDLKLNLARLRDVQENSGSLRLGSIPTEHIANAVERITTTQLRHFSEVNQTISPTYPLHIELPIRNGFAQNLVQIEINKDSSANEKKQDRRWLVKLKFDFEETGKFEARTSIQANKVSIVFVAEEKDTFQKLQENIPTLKEQLRNKDIDVERLDTFQAKLANVERNIQTYNKPLIDVRT